MIAKYSCLFAILAINAGCVTWAPSANDAAAAVALVAPQYAGAVDLVTKSVSLPKSAKSSTPTLEGFVYREVYRYKGTVCDASDVTMERILIWRPCDAARAKY